jgi:hypothetical protein
VNLAVVFHKRFSDLHWGVDQMKQLKEKFKKYRRARSVASRLLCPLTPNGICFLHQGRCGSTVLGNMLNQHPRISFRGEIFEHFMKEKRLPIAPTTMLREHRIKSYPQRPVVAVKFFECQHLSLMGLGIKQFVERVKNAGFKKILY